jgi:hypothetical protein
MNSFSAATGSLRRQASKKLIWNLSSSAFACTSVIQPGRPSPPRISPMAVRAWSSVTLRSSGVEAFAAAMAKRVEIGWRVGRGCSLASCFAADCTTRQLLRVTASFPNSRWKRLSAPCGSSIPFAAVAVPISCAACLNRVGRSA